MKIECKYYDEESDKLFKYAHQKRDGHYLAVTKTLQGDIVCLTSQPTIITEKLRWHSLYKCAQSMFNGSTVIGELWAQGTPASQIKTLINAQSTELQFSAFGLTMWRSINQSAIPSLPLHTVQIAVEAHGFDFCEYLELSTGSVTRQHNELVVLLDNCANTDVEGYVLKNGNLLDWHKLKPAPTIDLIICGYVPADFAGKYAGQIGSLVVSTAEGCEVGFVSGMNDEQRLEFTSNKSLYIGKVCEVGYQKMDSNGRLRHPRFIQLRDDKPADKCTLDQDHNLLRYWSNALKLK